MNQPKTYEGAMNASGRRFAVVASRFNDALVDDLLRGALDTLRRAGAEDDDVEVFRCPGAMELPAVVGRVAASGRFAGIVVLGVVIRGATPHFDVVVREAAAGVGRIAALGEVAVGFGLLTTDTIEQAIERAGTKAGNKGSDAALVAVEMADLLAQLARPAAVAGSRPKSK